MKSYLKFLLLCTALIYLISCGGNAETPANSSSINTPTNKESTATPKAVELPATPTPAPTHTRTPTPAPTATPVNFVETYQRYFNNHDLDGLLTLYADDVICNNCGSHVIHVEGKEALAGLLAHELAVNPTVKLQFCTDTGTITTCNMVYQNDLLAAAGLESVMYTAVNFSFVEGLIQTESHMLGPDSAATLDHIWNTFYPWVTASYPTEANQLFDETDSYISSPENAVLMTGLLPEWFLVPFSSEGKINIGEPVDAETFSSIEIIYAEVDEKDIDTVITNAMNLTPVSSCPEIWIEPVWGIPDLVPTYYNLFVTVSEEEGFVTVVQPTTPDIKPFAIAQVAYVSSGGNGNVLIYAEYEPDEGYPLPDELEIKVILAGCAPYTILTSELVNLESPTPVPSVIVVTPPSAEVQATALDLGIEHLQIGQEAVLEGSGFLIGLLNEPDGDNVATVVKGSQAIIQAFTIYDDVFWYLVETEDGTGWVSEFQFVPMDQVHYSVTPEALSVPMLPQLVTSDDMNELDNEFEIYDWQLSSEIAFDSRACRDFYGMSWSINPNLSINCIFPVPADTTFERAIEVMFEWEILASSANTIKLNNSYGHEAMLYADRYGNGHAVYDLFVMGEDALYWASVSMGVPVGETAANLYAAFSSEIEAFLFSIVQINLERSDE